MFSLFSKSRRWVSFLATLNYDFISFHLIQLREGGTWCVFENLFGDSFARMYIVSFRNRFSQERNRDHPSESSSEDEVTWSSRPQDRASRGVTKRRGRGGLILATSFSFQADPGESLSLIFIAIDEFRIGNGTIASPPLLLINISWFLYSSSRWNNIDFHFRNLL